MQQSQPTPDNPFLQDIDARLAQADLDMATGLLLEVITAFGYRQLIGPYPKDTADIYAAIESLRSEEDEEAEPNAYAVHLLFAPSHAVPR